MKRSRREFLQKSSIVGVGALVSSTLCASGGASRGTIQASGPAVIASGNGLRSVEEAMDLIQGGADALDAVIAGVNILEEDPEDTSVGYGGLPNEEGIVELDAAVMHGPTHSAGAVGALRNIKTPSRVARLVMERTDHVLLVGEGALRFARAHGFPEVDLLTEKARKEWLQWIETHSGEDDWLPPGKFGRRETDAPAESEESAPPALKRDGGTIHCSGIDMEGNISSVTSTSGLAFKLPGRVGDSPIIGAGLYVDNEIGAAGSTGRGEATLANCSCVMIVEYMRRGRSPEEACLQACVDIVEHNKESRLRDRRGLPTFNVRFYAINKRGDSGGAGIFKGSSYAFHDGRSARLIPLPYIYEK
ncbi:MAG: N(4)-(beta-N-acetylglucosaminyl)-L-asparaginase [Bacteroidota bacterium]